MKKSIKIVFIIGIILIVGGIIYKVKDPIYVYVDQYLSPYKYVSLGDVNDYYRDIDFEFVQNTDLFVPLNEQDLINIYYTVINAGKNSFTFYCTNEYEQCMDDVQDLANDRNKLSSINNYVHPYNGFSHIETEYDSLGKVTINIVRNYTPEEISEINQKVDELSTQLILPNDSLYNNIKRVHDYIISHAEYDTIREQSGSTAYDSDIAYGPLFQGMAVCSGYTDLMQLFLEKMEVPNFRVSSEQHVWNAVYYNGRWLHIDLTWDDPVVDGQIRPEEHYLYFLIDTNQLKQVGASESLEEHFFIPEYFPELK